MTPNEIGQLCYEAHQEETRKLCAGWFHIPWHAMSVAQQIVWEKAGGAVYYPATRTKDEELEAAESLGYTYGYADGVEDERDRNEKEDCF